MSLQDRVREQIGRYREAASVPAQGQFSDGMKEAWGQVAIDLDALLASPEEPGLRHASAQVVDAWENDKDLAIPMMNLSDALAARPAEDGLLQQALEILKRAHGAEDAFYALSAFLQGKPYPAEDGLLECLQTMVDLVDSAHEDGVIIHVPDRVRAALAAKGDER